MTAVPDLAHLAERLMAIESTSGHEHVVTDFAARFLVDQGWHVQRIAVPATPGALGGRECVFARCADDFDLTFSTHLDTVPPYIAPHCDGAILRGRGACDAKGIAASMMMAADALRQAGIRVALLFVVGEETTHDGATAANAWIARSQASRSRILINGEPTGCTLSVGTKGAQRAIIRTSGIAGHSAYPDKGRSATRDLVRLLAELDTLAWPADPVLGDTTVNIGHLSGGVADNVFAPEAEARLMFRLVTNAQVIRDQVTAWIGARASVEWGVTVPPVRLGVVPGFETSVAAFATDIPALGNWGTPYLYGPGSIHDAHTAHEFVSIDDLHRAVVDYQRLARAALAGILGPA